MKKILLLFYFFCLSLIGHSVYAQISEGGIPPSFVLTKGATINAEQKTDYIAPINFDVQQLKSEDLENEQYGIPPRIGTVIPVDLKYPESGKWIELSGGQKVWQLSIKASDAVALSLYYEKFSIPERAKLFIYNADHTHILGAYTEKTNVYGQNFATELIAGDHIILEYVPTNSQQKEPEIVISGINYGYNNLSLQYNSHMGNSASCQVNVNCKTGWDKEKEGVYKAVFKKSGETFLCSGAMLNNAKQDLTPISLTAFHCIDGITESELNEAVFYFKYQQEQCNGGETDINAKTMVGASLLTSSPLSGNSDGALIKLNENIPAEYHVYYNGWDNGWGAMLTAPKGGVSIHHPAGDVMKIAAFTKEATSISWDNTLARDTHWKVYWDEGLTEGGSSGAPLFNADGYIVGSLSGAPTTVDPCLNPIKYSLFGKFAHFWNENSNVRGYLDSENKGFTRLKGTYVIDNKYYDIRTDQLNIGEVYVGQTLVVKNESTVEQQTYKWEVMPPSGTLAYYSTQDLSVLLMEEGDYTISLKTIDEALLKSLSFTTKTRKGNIEEVTIGVSTFTIDGLESPLGQKYTLSRTASVYTPAELGGAGSISSLSWNVDNELRNGRKLEVYLKHISSMDMSSDWNDHITGATLVYTSPDNWSNIKGWNLINLDIPFEYDGTSYLEVLTVSKPQGEQQRAFVYYYNNKGIKSYMSWAPNGNAAEMEAKPNIKIGISRPIALTSPIARFAYAIKTWDEGFDDSESLSEWTVNTSSGNGWQIGETIHPFSDIDPLSKKSILVGENSGVNAHTKLISPIIPVPTNSSRIEFYLAHASGNGMIDLAISEDGDGKWNQRTAVEQKNSGSDWAWKKHEIDISSYQGKDIKLMFIVSGENGLVALDGLKLLSLEEDAKIKQGEYIYPVDLSTGFPNTYDWNFPSASPGSSSNSNPGAIKYSNLGKYDVVLTVTNAQGTDTDSLPQSIEVTPNLPIPLFEAKGGYQTYPDYGRLIPIGGSIEFTDLSKYSSNVEWSFSGANPTTSTISTPTVNYSTAGLFDVNLKANSPYSVPANTLNKAKYVQVGGQAKIWNIPQGNEGKTTYNKIGKNDDNYTVFAEKFDKTTYGVVSKVDILFNVLSKTDEKIYVSVCSSNEHGLPCDVLATKELNALDITDGVYTTVEFDSPASIDGEFFICITVPVVSEIKILASSVNAGKNTAYVHYDLSGIVQEWFSVSSEFGVNLSLNIVPTFKFSIYKLSFNSNGGGVFTDKDVIYYQPVGDLPTPQRSNYIFVGWYLDLNDPLSKYSNSTLYPFEADMTLYAKWIVIPPSIEYQTVTLSTVEGVITNLKTGDHFVKEGESFSFTVTLDNLHQKDTIVVTSSANEKVLKPDANGKYTISDIRESVEIYVTLKPYKVIEVGNETPTTNDIKVWGADEVLHIYLDKAQEVTIYNITGQLVYRAKLPAGDTVKKLSQGLYIVRISNDKVVKVLL